MPDENIVKWAKDNGANIKIMNDPMEACKDSNAILTDTWVSMGDQKDKSVDHFKPFQVNSDLMLLANKNAIFMHCLPAKREQEVTSDILDSKKSVVLQQAKN